MSTKKEHTVKKILAEKIEELKASQNSRLDEIEKFVRGELAKINDRNKAVNGYVVSSNSAMQQKLYNMELTIDGLKAILKESNVFPDLDERLAAKRAELHEQYEKDAQEQMKKNTEQQAPAEEQKPAEQAPQAEEPKPEQAQG